MSAARRRYLKLLLVVTLGCGKETESVMDVSNARVEQSPASARTAAAAVTLAEKTFPDGIGNDKCAVLTLGDVAAATGVPASAIEQRPISGCLYSWKAGDTWPEGSVMITSVRVHPSIDRAKQSHQRFTRDVDAAEVAPARRQVQGELARKAADGEITKRTASVGSAVVAQMPDRDYRHQALTGVGSEAALERRTVNMRYGNLTIRYGGRIGESETLDPEIATALGQSIVRNLDGM